MSFFSDFTLLFIFPLWNRCNGMCICRITPGCAHSVEMNIKSKLSSNISGSFKYLYNIQCKLIV